MKWKKLQISEPNTKSPSNYFTGKQNALFSKSKFIQINKTSLYLIGGRNEYQSLLRREYDVPTSCVRVDLGSGELV